MRTSVSHLKDHMICPALANFRHVALRGPARASKALELGTWLHTILAEKIEGREPFFQVPEHFPEEWLNDATKIAALAGEWEMPKDWQVHAVEREMSLPIGRHELVGRLDAVVKWGGGFWHVQHKSLARQTPLHTYGDLIRYDWHEVVYQAMAEREGYQPFFGTILNVLKKGVPKGESPYHVDYLARDQVVTQVILKDIEFVLDGMEEQYMFEPESNARLVEIGMLRVAYRASGGYNDRVVGNRSACMGPFRNSPCSYLRVCNREVSIDDDAVFVDLEARYGRGGDRQGPAGDGVRGAEEVG